ncbi:MAG TPA: gliding motility-associated C-terminal domain-containing protein [Puia sp.]|nr:gliding motility-associated C-terminal domain-containing protein [Puia sp.]
MTKRTFTLLLIMMAAAGLSLPFDAFSQTLLRPDQPEQDACHPLSLCGGKFFTPYSYQGKGRKVDLSNTPCDSGENNSMWLKVTVATSGVLAFRIVPADTSDDYDFAVIDGTHATCNSLSPSDVVRCNFNNNEPGSNPGGIVGLSDTGTSAFVKGGYFGNPFIKAIQATAGQTYLVMINNFGHDDNPGPSNGFTIDFSTSTATFVADSLPAFQSFLPQCSDSSLTISLNKPVLCSSIAPDGTDFTISPFLPVMDAAGVNCVGANGYTQQVIIHFGTHAAPGNYTLKAQKGSDGTTILDLCGDAMAPQDVLAFTIPRPITGKFLPPDTTKCNYSTISIVPGREFGSYHWSTGQNTPSIAATDSGLYKLYVTDNDGCAGADSIHISDSACPQYVYFPSAFTPNGDGRNDVFRPVFAGPTSDFKLAIYDRWGRAVFETGDPFKGWDGSAGGNLQPAGTYAWVCTYRLYQQPERMQRGTVILIR